MKNENLLLCVVKIAAERDIIPVWSQSDLEFNSLLNPLLHNATNEYVRTMYGYY